MTNNVENPIDRMKAMMKYGLQTEGKKNQYSGVEYSKVGADNKTYGIVREGTKYYIKVANKTQNVLKEDYDYVGGFCNRKNHEYHSYADALKNFEMKMYSLQEAYGNKAPIIESWNPDKKENLTVEATDKMRREILRQRQIMGNSVLIESKKNYEVNLNEACNGVGKEACGTQKDNIKKDKGQMGNAEGQGGDPFTENPDKEFTDTQKSNVKKQAKPVAHNVGVTKESKEVLGWNKNPDYLDTENGTEIGDSAPFDKPLNSEEDMDNGTVEEGKAIHNTDDLSGAGVGEIGDTAPFDKKPKKDGVNEAEEDLLGAEDVEDATADGTDVDDGSEDFEGDDEDFGSEDDDLGAEDDVEPTDDEDLEGGDSDIETRLASLEDIISKIADKLGVDEFEDDTLYDDDETPEEDDVDGGEEDFGAEDDFGGEEDDDDDYEVYESRSYKRMKRLNEDRLDYFGKHPAYRKKPMQLPTSSRQEKEGYYDVNDESAKGEQPFGQKIGSSAPFEIDPEALENAIAESIKRIVKGKKKI
jgi:hypothetical protein